MRTFLLRIAELQAHRLDGQQQIGENDGRVHIEGFDRLQGNGGGQIRALADLKHRVFRANIPVGLHIAAGLPHKPDRPDVGGPSPAGIEETTRHGSHAHG